MRFLHFTLQLPDLAISPDVNGRRGETIDELAFPKAKENPSLAYRSQRQSLR